MRLMTFYSGRRQSNWNFSNLFQDFFPGHRRPALLVGLSDRTYPILSYPSCIVFYTILYKVLYEASYINDHLGRKIRL